jgi:DNA polymerase-1
VKSIDPVGTQDVWDITVDEDGSYLAHGFVNHNSSNPNLQQLPRDSMVKKLYVSRFGKRGLIFQEDCSQIELRLLAAGCGDPTMVKAYWDNVDLHSLTTSRVFNTPYEHFEKTYMAWLQEHGREKEAKELNRKRSIGKTSNFLTGYGGGAFGLQSSLAEEGVYLPLEECERIVEALFDTYPGLRKHIGLYKRFIMNHGCAVSITGRVRALEDVHSDDGGRVSKALRSGFNHLIQPTASDMLLCAMTVAENLMRQAGLESVLVSTVHDSVVADVLRDEVPKVFEICDGVMNNMPEVMELVLGEEFDSSWTRVVPFAGDAEIGKNYLEALKIVPDKVTGNVDWDRLFHQIDS